MADKNVVFKKSCTYTQTPGLVSVKQLLIVEEGEKNYLALRLVNERAERVSSVTVKITEYDEGGKVICVTPIDFEVSGEANAVFVPNQKIELEADTRDCDVVVMSAVYGAYIYRAVKNKVVVDYNAAPPAPAVVAPKRRYAEKAGEAGIEVKPRKLKAPFLVVFAIVLSLVVSVFAAYIHMAAFVSTEKTFLYNGVEYEFDGGDTSDGTDIYVVGFNGFRSRVVIPAEIDGHAVKGIRNGAFKNNRSLVSIGFENELPIGDEVFLDCTSLRSVEFEKISSFGVRAFSGCAALESVVIRADMTAVPEEAFFGCTKLSSVLVEETGVRIAIGKHAFAECENLRTVEFKRQIDYSESGDCDFFCNSSVDELKLINFDLSSYGIARLFGTSGDKINLGRLYIGYLPAVFKNFAAGIAKLTSFEVAYLENADIGDGAFAGCTRLSALLLPKQVTSVGARAFSGTAITEMDLTAAAAIGESAFEGCINLKNLAFIGNTVIDTIGTAAFKDCTALDRITLPVNISELKFGTFSGCTALSEVRVTGDCKILVIGNEAFSGCGSLSAIPALGGGIKQIGARAFKNCVGFTDLIVPDTVVEIGVGAFEGCNKITSYTAPFIGQTDSAAGGAFARVFGGQNKNSYSVVPSTLVKLTLTHGTAVYEGALYMIAQLKSVTLPDTLVSVGEQAFYGCSGLDGMELPGGVSQIGSDAFRGCTGLREIELPDGLQFIGPRAFTGCDGLSELDVPSSVTSIGVGAFSDCDKLTSIVLPYATDAYFGNLFGANYMSGSANSVPASLERVEIVGSTALPAYAFYGCKNIKDIVLPSTLREIGSLAFYGCDGITSLVIPAEVTSLGEGVLAGMNSLTELSTPFVGGSRQNGGYSYDGRLSYMLEINGESMPYRKLEKITLTDSSNIGPNTFDYGGYIKQIVLACDVTQISTNAFEGCYALYEVFNGSKLNIVKGSDEFGGIARNVLAVHGSVDAKPLTRITTDDGYSFVQSGEGDWYMIDYPYESYYMSEDGKIPACVELTELPGSVSAEGHSFANYYVWQYLFRYAPFHAVVLPKNILGLGRYAFFGSDLTRVLFDEDGKAVEISEGAFLYCDRLYEVVLPRGVRFIGALAFYGCSRLKKFTIGPNVMSIGGAAFENCDRLFEVYNYSNLPIKVGDEMYGSVARVAKRVYDRTELQTNPNLALSQITINGVQYMSFDDDSKYWYVVDYYANESDTLELAPFVYKNTRVDSVEIYSGAFDFEGYNVKKLIIGNVIPVMRSDDFYRLRGVEEFTLVNNGGAYGEIEIEDYALYNAFGLKRIESDVNISRLGSYAFNLNNVQSVKLANVDTVCIGALAGYGDGFTVELGDVGLFESVALSGSNIKSLKAGRVGTIGSSAFSGCGRLASVELRSVESIGSYAFNGCNGLSDFKLGVGENAVSIDNYAFAGSGISEFIYSGEIDSIGTNAFSESYSLKKAELGNVNKIGNGAFSGCSKLSSFAADKAESIGTEAFSGCGALATVTFNGNVGSIGSRAFSGCGALATVTFNGNVGSIGTEAFAYSYSAMDVKIVGNTDKIEMFAFVNNRIKSVSFGGNVGSIGSYAFAYNTELASVSFGGSLGSLGIYSFADAHALTEITLPNELTAIPEYAFANCEGLRKVTLPSGLTSISNIAFSGSNNILVVYNRSELDVSNCFYYVVAVVRTAADAEMEIVQENGCTFAKIAGKWYLVSGYAYYNGYAYAPIEFTAKNGDKITSFGLAKFAFSGSVRVIIGSHISSISDTVFMYSSAVLYYEGSKADWSKLNKGGIELYVLYYKKCIHDGDEDVWRYDADGRTPTIALTQFAENAWKTTVEPTCVKDGKQEATCSDCGKKFERGLGRVNHQIENGKCKICGSEVKTVSSDNIDDIRGADIVNDGFETDGGKLVAKHGATVKITAKERLDVVLVFSVRIGSGLLIVRHNDSTLVNTSVTSGNTLPLTLQNGDVLTIIFDAVGTLDGAGAELELTFIYTEGQKDNA